MESQFVPNLRFTRYANEWLPEWAIPIHEYDSMICECDALPVIARYVAEVKLPRNQGIRKIRHKVCPVCLKLFASERGEYDQREANRLYDLTHAPERANGLYALRSVFAEYSKQRLKAWQRAGIVLSPTTLFIGNNKRPTPSIRYSDMIEWMKNPQTWHLWRAEGVKDEELRAWISSVRELWPWRWLSGAETCQSLGYGRTQIQGLSKLLQGVRGPKPTPTGNGGSGFFYRSDVVAWYKEVWQPASIGLTAIERRYGERFLRVDLRVPGSYRDAIREIGGNNFSKGVRVLLEEWRERNGGKRANGG